jgi:hypothetical protein
MAMFRRNPSLPRQSRGFGVVETIVVTSMILFVSCWMVRMVGDTLSNASRVVGSTTLVYHMRIERSMNTREVRCLNDAAAAELCFADPDCASDDTYQVVREGSAACRHSPQRR